ncbi:hypothetical protein B0H16DRAFT_1826225, partial [Mycena metata]
NTPSTPPTLGNLESLTALEQPILTARSASYLPPTMLYYPTVAIARAYLKPNIAMSVAHEDELRLETRHAWEQRRREHQEIWRTNPTYLMTVPEPVVIWLNRKENAFELKSRPWATLGAGDEIECFGVLVGTWRLTDKRDRRREWSTKKHRRLQEWVYCLVENLETGQETHVKMPAEFYYPATLTMRVTASLRKLGSLFTRHPL